MLENPNQPCLPVLVRMYRLELPYYAAAKVRSVQSKTSTALFTPNATTKYVEPGNTVNV